MFIFLWCSTAVGPRIKPVKNVVETRGQVYERLDLEAEVWSNSSMGIT